MKFAPWALALATTLLGCARDSESPDGGAEASLVSARSSAVETSLDPTAGRPVASTAWTAAPFYLWPEARRAAPVRTDAAGLRALICLDRPGLDALLLDDAIAAMAVICDWCAENLAYAADPWTVSLLDGAWPDDETARIYFDVFEPGVGGVYCGGSARFLQGVLRLFDYDAATMCFGIEGTDATHVVVIAALERGTSHRVSDPTSSPADLYLLDPTFNLSFLAVATHRPIPLGAILDSHSRGTLEDLVAIDRRSLRRRQYLLGNPPVGRGGFGLLPIAANQRFVICAHLGAFWHAYWRNHRHLLEPLGIDSGLKGYFQLLCRGVLSVDTGCSRALRARLHELCRTHRIPLCLTAEFEPAILSLQSGEGELEPRGAEAPEVLDRRWQAWVAPPRPN